MTPTLKLAIATLDATGHTLSVYHEQLHVQAPADAYHSQHAVLLIAAALAEALPSVRWETEPRGAHCRLYAEVYSPGALAAIEAVYAAWAETPVERAA